MVVGDMPSGPVLRSARGGRLAAARERSGRTAGGQRAAITGILCVPAAEPRDLSDITNASTRATAV